MCESVELTNVPSFSDRLDAPLEVEGLGTLRVDVAFGGMWYAIADARVLGFAIGPEEASELCAVGERIRLAAREQLPCTHPENREIAGISIVQLAEPWQGVGKASRNAVVVAPGRLDRSVTGTGLSARMAALHARGQMRAGDRMAHASVLGTTFDGRIVEETTVVDRPAIVPAIRGSAWITGVTQVLVDPTDPFPRATSYQTPGRARTSRASGRSQPILGVVGRGEAARADDDGDAPVESPLSQSPQPQGRSSP
jgi:proline racemase